jgi:hypothetical protein
MKQALSVTMQEDNILWLKGQAAATTGGNVSEVMDRLVRQARTSGAGDVAVRSVVGSIDLPSDAALDAAGTYVRALFERSLRRPLLVKARRPARNRARRG